jgi:hypothetical protein
MTLICVYIDINAFPSLYMTNGLDIVIKGKHIAQFRKVMESADMII